MLTHDSSAIIGRSRPVKLLFANDTVEERFGKKPLYLHRKPVEGAEVSIFNNHSHCKQKPLRV